MGFLSRLKKNDGGKAAAAAAGAGGDSSNFGGASGYGRVPIDQMPHKSGSGGDASARSLGGAASDRASGGAGSYGTMPNSSAGSSSADYGCMPTTDTPPGSPAPSRGSSNLVAGKKAYGSVPDERAPGSPPDDRGGGDEGNYGSMPTFDAWHARAAHRDIDRPHSTAPAPTQRSDAAQQDRLTRRNAGGSSGGGGDAQHAADTARRRRQRRHRGAMRAAHAERALCASCVGVVECHVDATAEHHVRLALADREARVARRE
eukprot:CAMPEP_0198323508 /NCGR_PEP_ID=MMETSP1450-20131203/11724_1 /TAXON_ID=753684 ORGANISM="Madagascaria erythrocladiodes, Strain CCMP3234" /NCGR_SAMPLE_ID=MMETSP1450 /ASSEMBLY_ACC=CAM_ASM_001115 /LENGTH=259 /DNA_ID=CAMNT_0044027219 /DNA_START=250 /DNA_END=1026 /DNA_ORIENTATION=-